MSQQSGISKQASRELQLYLSTLIKGKSRLAEHFTRWCIKGPTLGANAGITAMTQEEVGHIAVIRNILNDAGLVETKDGFAFPYLERTPKTWAELIVTIFVFDTLFTEIIQATLPTNYQPLENMKKLIEEEQFHQQFGDEWAMLLANSKNFKSELLANIKKALNDVHILPDKIPTDVLKAEGIINCGIEEILQRFQQRIENKLDQWGLSEIQKGA